MKIKLIASLSLVAQLSALNAIEPFGFRAANFAQSIQTESSSDLLKKLDSFIEGINNGSMIYNGDTYSVDCANKNFFVGKDRNQLVLMMGYKSTSGSYHSSTVTENGVVTSKSESKTPGSVTISITALYLANFEKLDITLHRVTN